MIENCPMGSMTQTRSLMEEERTAILILSRQTHTTPEIKDMKQLNRTCRAGRETEEHDLRFVMSPEQVLAEPFEDPPELSLIQNVDEAANMADATARVDYILPAMDKELIVDILGQHKCVDVTSKLILGSCGKEPFTGGGGGQIYRGIMNSGKLTKRIAIKCHRLLVGYKSRSTILRDAAKELYTWSKCKHTNVVPLLGLAQYHNQLAMVSPFIDGGSLSKFLLEHPGFDRLKACLQIGTGLAYLHALDVVHGDLKADNALVTDDGTIKIADFGSSVAKSRSLRFLSGNWPLSITPCWAAPEVLDGQRHPTKMSDMYAFGMTLLEVITSEIPFIEVLSKGGSLLRKGILPLQVIAGRRPNRPKCCIPLNNPGDLIWALLQQCWNHDPIARPSAIEARDRLRAIRIDRTKLLPGLHGNRECAPMCRYTPGPAYADRAQPPLDSHNV